MSVAQLDLLGGPDVVLPDQEPQTGTTRRYRFTCACHGRPAVWFANVTLEERDERRPGGMTYTVRSANPEAMDTASRCRGCGRSARMTAQPLKARRTSSRCDSRCMAATGPDCECGCAGANHGILAGGAF